MSDGQPVRTPLSLHDRSRRTLDQRLMVRFPRLFRVLAALVGRLSPRSRTRRMLVARSARLGMEAFNRRDLDVVLVAYHPQAEFHPPRELSEMGILAPSYRGSDGYRRFVDDWLSAWGSFRWDPHQLIDLGDRAVVLGEFTGRGEESGVALAQKGALVWTLDAGIAIREQHYLDHDEALEAAGLREHDLKPAE